MANFEREVSAAKKSKCEQNLFCIISLDLITAVGTFMISRNSAHNALFGYIAL